MAITITIDNDQLTAPIDHLILDESPGEQDSGTTDTGNDVPVTFGGGVWTGIVSAFGTYLNGLSLTAGQIQYIVDHGASSSASDFVTVEVTEEEEINNLFFSDAAGDPLDGSDEDLVVGMTTLDGEALYLWSFGDFAFAATRNEGTGDPVKIVAIFHLNEDPSHLTAQVQMVTTEPLLHLDTGSTDDGLNFTDVLNVSASGSLSFDFDGLPSGNFLYAAFGSDTIGLLVTGADLNVKETGGPSQVGEMDGGGGKNGDPSDSVNTSQGGVGTSATIGINSQHFTDGNNSEGATGVFTLVSGFVPLETEIPATGTNISEINYDGYINVFGAAFFISQSESGTADFRLSLWRAGGTDGANAETQLNYIGNQATDSAILHDDIEVAVDTVTIQSGGNTYIWNSGNSGAVQGSITVVISGNDITVHGMDATDTISWTSMDVAGDAGDGSFNRFSVTALNGSGGFDIGRIDLSQGVTIPAPIGSNLIVEDDGPAPGDGTFAGHVDEDALSAGNIEDDGDPLNLDDDGDGIDGEQDEFSFDQVDLAGLVQAGTDGPAYFYLNDGVSGNVQTTGGDDVTSKGVQITWKVDGGVIQGVTDADTTDERIIFTITVDDNSTTDDPSDDVFTFTLLDQVDHLSALGDLANLELDISPALAARDADLDPVDFEGAAVIGMEVENDTPIFTAQIADGTVEFAADSTGTVTKSLNGSVGGDENDADDESASGVKTYTFVEDSWSEPNSVFADLDGVLSADGTQIIFYKSSDPLLQIAANAVYRITLDQDGAGTYTFEVLQPPPFNQTNFDFTDLPSGQNLLGVIADDKADLGKGGLLVFSNNMDINDGEAGENTSGTMTNTSGTVNTSKGGGPVTIGNTNQAFDHFGEGTFFCYVDNPLASAVGGLGLTQVTADDADTAKFNGTNEVTTASVEIVQASGKGTDRSPGPAMHIFAYDVDPGDVNLDSESRAFLTNPTDGATKSNIIGVIIYDAAGNPIEHRINLEDGDNNDGDLVGAESDVKIHFILDDDNGTAGVLTDDIYSIVVENLKKGYTVEFVTEDPHDLALVENVSGSFDIGGFNVKNTVDVPDQDFDFTVQITDYDNDVYGGDSVNFAKFSVSIDGFTF